MKRNEKDIIELTLKHSQCSAIFYNIPENIPSTSGIYMLAQKIMPFSFNEEIIYLLKVGKSNTNLKRRINSYKGMNPTIACIDYLATNPLYTDTLEQNWLDLFSKKYPGISGSTEWFMVPKEDFDYYCEHGFNYY